MLTSAVIMNTGPLSRGPIESSRYARTALCFAVLIAGLLALKPVCADDLPVLSTSDSFDLSISGKINRAVMIASDGTDTTVFHVDNNNSSSRILFLAESNSEGRLSAGTAYEFEFAINNSAGISQKEANDNDAGAYRVRRAELFIEDKQFGRLWLGQGPTATDGVAQRDLSGTMNAGFSFVNLVGGGILFRDASTGQLSNTDMGDVADNLAGC